MIVVVHFIYWVCSLLIPKLLIVKCVKCIFVSDGYMFYVVCFGNSLMIFNLLHCMKNGGRPFPRFIFLEVFYLYKEVKQEIDH